MKTLFTILTFAFLSITTWCQPELNPPPPPPVEVTDEQTVFPFPEVLPVYPGGEAAMQSFIMKSLVYPTEAKEANLQGRVFVKMIVEKDGSVSNVHVVRGAPNAPMLDKEAVRVIRLLKFEQPAKNNGEPVRYEYIVPVMFKLT